MNCSGQEWRQEQLEVTAVVLGRNGGGLDKGDDSGVLGKFR